MTNRRQNRPSDESAGFGDDRQAPHDPACDDLSPAGRLHRRRRQENARRIAASAQHTRRAISGLRDLIPNRWQISAGQHVDGAPHTIDITPPSDRVDVMAYLCTPHGETGWRVRVYNRTRKVDYPLYSHGGARAAEYRTARDALAAAINALRIDLGDSGPR